MWNYQEIDSSENVQRLGRYSGAVDIRIGLSANFIHEWDPGHFAIDHGAGV